MRRVFFAVGLLCVFMTARADTVGDARGAQSRADDLSNELMNKMIALETETNAKKVPLLAERNTILAGVEGFWARTVENHPSHANWIFGQDREIMKYVTDLAIEEIEPNHHHFKVILTLRGNPFIANEKIWRTVTGQEDEQTGTIDWVGESKPTGLSFFNYFDSKAQTPLEPQTVSDITHVLRYELYQNPFTFYDLPTMDELAAQHFEESGELPDGPEDGSEPQNPADEPVELDAGDQ